MSQATKADGAGGEQLMQKPILMYKDIALPPFCTLEHMEALMKMEFRPQDIILSTFPKAGTHWFYEMMQMLVKGRAEPVRDPPIENTMLEFPFCDLQKVQEMPSPRVFCTHLPFHVLPPSALALKCRLVVVERNVKDVAVSMYNMMQKSKMAKSVPWNGFIDDFLTESAIGIKQYFVHFKGYRRAAEDMSGPPICFFSFEKTKQDHVGQLGRLSSFMGLDRSPKLWDEIAALTEFKSMQKYKAQEEGTEAVKLVFKSGKDEMYRKGVAGDWKNWFTVAQSEMADAAYLKEMGVPFKM